MSKVVLAYSGGLDTSVCVHWLKKKKNLDVITLSADLGQGDLLKTLGDRALASGAASVHIADVKEKFVKEFVWPSLRANALYQGRYPLATALGRPLIAHLLVTLANENNADYISHGCTGKGNDQVRIETSIAALAPHLKIVAPLREWNLKSREEEIEYAQKYNIPIEIKEATYSYDRNLWGVSIECGSLEDPWTAPPEDAYLMTKSPEDAPDSPEEITMEFFEGIPVTLNGEALSGAKLIQKLNATAGAHGVGRIDMVEDRLIGIKSREVYEAPAATVLVEAHKALEAITLSRDVSNFQRQLSDKFAELVYYGLWFSPLREALESFFDYTQEKVSGTVRVKLYKGIATVVGRKSPESLYNQDLATYTDRDSFDHSASEGFIKIWSLPVKGSSKKPNTR